MVESWSAKEDVLALSIEKDARFSMWTLSLPKRTLEPFGGVQSSFPPNAVFSPDGRWLAYASGEGYLVEIYAQRFPSAGDVFSGLARLPQSSSSVGTARG